MNKHDPGGSLTPAHPHSGPGQTAQWLIHLDFFSRETTTLWSEMRRELGTNEVLGHIPLWNQDAAE